VLDPLSGSGTTCLAAIKSGRHFVGYEIRADYVELSYKRLLSLYDQLELFDIDNQHMIPVLTKLQKNIGICSS
jgi:DNA modification methylase